MFDSDDVSFHFGLIFSSPGSIDVVMASFISDHWQSLAPGGTRENDNITEFCQSII